MRSRILFYGFCSLLFIQALAAQSQATSGNAPCPDFKLPLDPSNCTLVDQAKIQYQFLRNNVQTRYAQDSSIDVESMDQLIEIVRYLSSCERLDCRKYDFDMKRDLEHGWKKIKSALITTTDNRCQYNKKYLLADSHSTIDTPATTTAVMVKKMPTKARPEEPFYSFPNTRLSCPSGEGRLPVLRSFIFSYKGIYISDTPDGDVSESLKSGTSRINIRGGGRPEMLVQDAQTLRFQWPNGAYIDLGNDGNFKDSNFLDASSFTNNQCQGRASANGRSAGAPRVTFKPDQRFAR